MSYSGSAGRAHRRAVERRLVLDVDGELGVAHARRERIRRSSPTAAATGRVGGVGVAALEHPHAVQAQLHERRRVHVEQREAVLELREARLVARDGALARAPRTPPPA